MPKIINQDHEVQPCEVYSLEELLESGRNFKELDAKRLEQTCVRTLARFFERLSTEDCRAMLQHFPALDASAILGEMSAEASADIIVVMREWRALNILTTLTPDDAVDVLYELGPEDQGRLLGKLPPEKAKQLKSLLRYPKDTAGGIMNSDVLSVKAHLHVDDAIHAIRQWRKNQPEKMHTSYIYAVDEEGKLRGVLTLDSLILADPNSTVESIMNTELEGVCSPYEDREKVAQAMADSNLFDLPVVDSDGKLLGIVEHDDVIDIIQSEATEDFQKLVGAGADETIHDKLYPSLKRRRPWLIVNLLTALIAAAVVSLFQGEITQLSLLAVFMPAIASLGGNTGAQTLAVSLRSMTVGGHIERVEALRICLKEGSKGLLNGLFVGCLASSVVYIFTRQLSMALVVYLALVLNMALGGLVGACIPLILRRFGFDPAQSSSIFLTGTTDICGFFIFLALGAWLLF